MTAFTDEILTGTSLEAIGRMIANIYGVPASLIGLKGVSPLAWARHAYSPPLAVDGREYRRRQLARRRRRNRR